MSGVERAAEMVEAHRSFKQRRKATRNSDTVSTSSQRLSDQDSHDLALLGDRGDATAVYLLGYAFAYDLAGVVDAGEATVFLLPGNSRAHGQ